MLKAKHPVHMTAHKSEWTCSPMTHLPPPYRGYHLNPRPDPYQDHQWSLSDPIMTHFPFALTWILIRSSDRSYTKSWLILAYHNPWPCLRIPYESWLTHSTTYSSAPLMTHPLTVHPLTLPHKYTRPPWDLPHRHLAFLYISQLSRYLVAPVLTWLPSHTLCAITSWILSVHPLCVWLASKSPPVHSLSL